MLQFSEALRKSFLFQNCSEKHHFKTEIYNSTRGQFRLDRCDNGLVDFILIHNAVLKLVDASK